MSVHSKMPLDFGLTEMDKVWIPTLQKIGHPCCLNCTFFNMHYDDVDDGQELYSTPTCEYKQNPDGLFDIWGDSSWVKEALHREFFMEAFNNVYLEMYPVPDFTIEDVPCILKSNEVLNNFLLTLGISQVEEDEYLSESASSKVFMAIGRVGKKLLLEEGITKEEYYGNEKVVAAYIDSLPRQRSEKPVYFGSMSDFICRAFEHESSVCHFWMDKRSGNVSVALIAKEL